MTLPVADCKYSPHPLRVFKKRLETEVHVVLDVAMEQRRAGLIGQQIHRCSSIVRHDHVVLDDSRSGRSVHIH